MFSMGCPLLLPYENLLAQSQGEILPKLHWRAFPSISEQLYACLGLLLPLLVLDSPLALPGQIAGLQKQIQIEVGREQGYLSLPIEKAHAPSGVCRESLGFEDQTLQHAAHARSQQQKCEQQGRKHSQRSRSARCEV
jgi:hypothetical protein